MLFENTMKSLVDRYYDLFSINLNNQESNSDLNKEINKISNVRICNLCKFLLSIVDSYCPITLPLDSDYFLVKIFLLLTLSSTKNETTDTSNSNSDDDNNDNTSTHKDFDNDHNDKKMSEQRDHSRNGIHHINDPNNKPFPTKVSNAKSGTHDKLLDQKNTTDNDDNEICGFIIIARNMIIDGIMSAHEIIPQHCHEIFSNYGHHWSEYHDSMKYNDVDMRKDEFLNKRYRTNDHENQKDEIDINELNKNDLKMKKNEKMKQHESNPASINSNMKQMKLLQISIRLQLLLSLFNTTLLSTAAASVSSSLFSKYKKINMNYKSDTLLYSSILNLSLNCIRIIPLLALTIRTSLLFGCLNYRYDLIKLILCNPPHFDLKYLSQIFEKYQDINKNIRNKKHELNLNANESKHNLTVDSKLVSNEYEGINDNNKDGNSNSGINKDSDVWGKTPVESVGYIMNRGQIDEKQNLQNPQNAENTSPFFPSSSRYRHRLMYKCFVLINMLI